MTGPKIDFQKINALALSRLPELLSLWLPGGHTERNEYVCANLGGKHGRSCSVNMTTGEWGDFSTDARGKDVTSLYAAINGLRQAEAARQLSQELGMTDPSGDGAPRTTRPGQNKNNCPTSGRIIATYDYLDANGRLVFQVVRKEPKDFRQRRPDGRGGWEWTVKGTELIPYQLPEIIKTQALFIVEGEKDADALATLGLIATTCPQGAGKWQAKFNPYFKGKRVCILPDNDEPGRKHAQTVARHLHKTAEAVKIVELPGLPPKGDVSDWLKAGGTRDALLEMAKAASMWEPQALTQEQSHLALRADDGTIRIQAGELAVLVDACEVVLARPDLRVEDRVFQRGGQLWRVGVLPAATTGDGVTRPAGAVCIFPVTAPFLMTVLSRHGRFEKFDARKKVWIPADPPKAAAEAILARAGMWPFSNLRGVVGCPTIRPDGSILNTPGYDVATGYFIAHNLAISVSTAPTPADVAQAVLLLRELLTGFSFVEDVDRSVALALILTAIVRPAMDSVPLFAITAPVRGSGKSTLMDIAAVLATGRRSAVLSATADPGELEKRLVGCLLSGDAIINLDNLNGELSSDLLCQATTAESVKVRPLGASSQVEIPNTCLWSANGNNLTLAGDLSRRTLLCRLDPGVERPEERVFAFDPVAEAIKNRGTYVSAVLTVMRGYVVAGRPDMGLLPFGSFDRWAGLARNALFWAGEPDPCASRATVMDDDPEAATLRAMVGAWWERFGRTPQTVKEIIKAAEDDDSPLADPLEVIAGERNGSVNAKRFGRWLRRNTGRIVDGRKIHRTEITMGGSVQWKVLPQESS
jgi:putative DNA primase/helicase